MAMILETVWEEDLTQYANQAAAETGGWSITAAAGGAFSCDGNGFLHDTVDLDGQVLARKSAGAVCVLGDWYVLEYDEASSTNCLRQVRALAPTIHASFTLQTALAPTGFAQPRLVFQAIDTTPSVDLLAAGPTYIGGTGSGSLLATAIRIRRIVSANKYAAFA